MQHKDYRAEVDRLFMYVCMVIVVPAVLCGVCGIFEVMLGILLGGAGSVGYFLLLYRRVDRSVDMPLGQAVAYMRRGTLQRLLLVACVVIIAVRLPMINIFGVMFGLLALQSVIYLRALGALFGFGSRRTNKKER